MGLFSDSDRFTYKWNILARSRGKEKMKWNLTFTFPSTCMYLNHFAVAGDPGYPIDGNRWSEKQSINRYQSIKLVNWYRLVLVNRWSIDNHTKIVHRLASIGTAPRDRRHARYLSDHLPFLGSPGDEIGRQFQPRLLSAKNIPCCTRTRITHLPVIAFPCHNV